MATVLVWLRRAVNSFDKCFESIELARILAEEFGLVIRHVWFLECFENL